MRDQKMSTTCGVLITNGTDYLICHPTNGRWWDIPKGQQDPGETYAETAVRELTEETGLVIAIDQLEDLGVHDYRPKKRLALFKITMSVMPDPTVMICKSKFKSGMNYIPEMDGYQIVCRSTCLAMVNPSMRKVLEQLI
jgi:putative (di)nucleoside polyphosphate hydrolase